MGLASKIANSQNAMGGSGAYSGAPPAGYTGGPPASLQPGGAPGGYNPASNAPQQPQYQAYPGASPSPLRPGSAQSPYPTSPPPAGQGQYQAYPPPSVPPNKPVPSPSPMQPGYAGAPPHTPSPAPQGYPPASYSPAPPTPQGYPPASPYGQPPRGAPPQPYGAPGQYPPQPSPYPQQPPQQHAPYPGAPPPGPYGPPGGAPPTRATEQQLNAYRQLLIATIQENQLQSFYPPERLDRVIQGLANEGPGKINRLCHEWNVPQEVGMDIIKLSLFDVVIYVDDSGSIEFEERGVRKEQLKQILGIVATAASTFDEDGISVRFMNSSEQGDGIRSVADVERLVGRVRFQSLTPLGTGLRNKVLEPMVVNPARAGRLQKPVLVITITDGQPAGEPLETVANSIRYAVDEVSRTPCGRGAVSFQFSQVGNDNKAREFLRSLDEDPSIGNLIDCTSNFEVEQDEMMRAVPPVHLTRELWCAKLMLGAIDISYDTKDEKAAGAGGGGGPAGHAPPPGPPPGQYGGYNPGPGYGQPSPYGQPPAQGYGQPPAPYNPGGAPPYGQPGYPPNQGHPPAPGYGQQPPQQQYGGYGPPGGAPPSGYPPQGQYGQGPPPPPRY